MQELVHAGLESRDRRAHFLARKISHANERLQDLPRPFFTFDCSTIRSVGFIFIVLSPPVPSAAGVTQRACGLDLGAALLGSSVRAPS